MSAPESVVLSEFHSELEGQHEWLGVCEINTPSSECYIHLLTHLHRSLDTSANTDTQNKNEINVRRGCILYSVGISNQGKLCFVEGAFIHLCTRVFKLFHPAIRADKRHLLELEVKARPKQASKLHKSVPD